MTDITITLSLIFMSVVISINFLEWIYPNADYELYNRHNIYNIHKDDNGYYITFLKYKYLWYFPYYDKVYTYVGTCEYDISKVIKYFKTEEDAKEFMDRTHERTLNVYRRK